MQGFRDQNISVIKCVEAQTLKKTRQSSKKKIVKVVCFQKGKLDQPYPLILETKKGTGFSTIEKKPNLFRI